MTSSASSAPSPDAKATPSSADATEADRERAAQSVIERMLAQRQTDAGGGGVLRQTTVAAWQGGNGTLAGGVAAGRSASCLIRPETGDTVLAWCPLSGGRAHVIAVLARSADAAGREDAGREDSGREETRTVLSAEQPLAIEAPSVGITAKVVQIACQDLLTHAKNAHAVEETRTETARVRIAQIGTDIRRATTVDDEISGTLLQRAGTWISNTVREARFKARSFLFD